MSTYLKLLFLAALIMLSCGLEAKSPAKQDKKVDAKCYVELIGGGEMITFWNIPSKKLSGLSKSIVGHQVMKPKTKQKAKIYKAYECVLLKNEFSTSKAKIVDAKTAR